MQGDIMILDGAWGTLLRERGMPEGVCPEYWAWQRLALAGEIARAYVQSGAQSVLTPTFGANPLRLESWGLREEYRRINRDLATHLRRSLPEGTRLGGDMGPSGLRLFPHSAMTFEDAVRNYATQAQALLEGGVDYFHVETMTDLNEARAALIGIRQVSDLPVFATMAFAGGQTLAGDRPACCTIVLEALGATAVGANCGRFPDDLMDVIQDMSAHARKPVIAKPSAGIPGDLLEPEEFVHQTLSLVAAGARYVGACCGSSPEHIRLLHDSVEELRFLPLPSKQGWMLSSRSRHLPFANALIIGNLRVASNGRFLYRIRQGDYAAVRGEIDNMGEAQMLCINAVAEDLDEINALQGVAREAWEHTDLPMAFRPKRPEALEAVLREYPGKALVILDCVADKERAKVQEIAARYGALCML